jgi:hypothetical protein
MIIGAAGLWRSYSPFIFFFDQNVVERLPSWKNQPSSSSLDSLKYVLRASTLNAATGIITSLIYEGGDPSNDYLYLSFWHYQSGDVKFTQKISFPKSKGCSSFDNPPAAMYSESARKFYVSYSCFNESQRENGFIDEIDAVSGVRTAHVTFPGSAPSILYGDSI